MADWIKDIFSVEFSINNLGEKSKVIKVSATLPTKKGVDALTTEIILLRNLLSDGE